MYLDRNKEDKICEEGIDDLGGKEEQAFSRLSFLSAFEPSWQSCKEYPFCGIDACGYNPLLCGSSVLI